MGTEIYLGMPSPRVVEWIKNQRLKEPLCFTAVDAGATIAFNKVGEPDAANIVTSTDKHTWTPYDFNTKITLANPGDKVYFRAADENDISFFKDYYNYYKFATTNGKRIAASGNIQTLMKAGSPSLDISGKNSCYNSMFYNCSSLTTAPELPATTLASECYRDMFYGCSSLTTAPELPATTLASNCYDSMFRGCSSLITVPELPATTLASSCYSYMFQNCMSLTTAPTLLATKLALNCYSSMFSGCSSLASAPELPATTLADNCYSQMFRDCTSLISAPELPATTLAYICYNGMFLNCSQLTSINVNFSAWGPTKATTNWLKNVAASGTFTCPAALPKTTGVSYIPEGWTIVEK